MIPLAPPGADPPIIDIDFYPDWSAYNELVDLPILYAPGGHLWSLWKVKDSTLKETVGSMIHWRKYWYIFFPLKWL